jgi:hypothetical protein
MGSDDGVRSNDLLFSLHVRIHFDLHWSRCVQTRHVRASERVSRVDPANHAHL